MSGGSQQSGQLRSAASDIAWSSARLTPLAACTAMPKARVDVAGQERWICLRRQIAVIDGFLEPLP
ncbi:hypothetical protein ACWHA1_29780 [Streptomyces decoyicus]